MKFKYSAYLRNSQGAVFDDGHFTSKKAARDWARGRGGWYTLTIELDEGVFVERRTYGRRAQ